MKASGWQAQTELVVAIPIKETVAVVVNLVGGSSGVPRASRLSREGLGLPTGTESNAVLGGFVSGKTRCIVGKVLIGGLSCGSGLYWALARQHGGNDGGAGRLRLQA